MSHTHYALKKVPQIAQMFTDLFFLFQKICVNL